jgi:hypothetical protein
VTDIRIDAPGCGQWVMDRCGRGVFNPSHDHSFTSHDGDQILGGFVLCHYLGNSMMAHMACEDKRWLSKDLLWLPCHYAFVQLGCGKVLGPMRSDNHRAISIALRAGWTLETVIRDVYAPGVDMMLLVMTKDTCRWLAYEPKVWAPRNRRVA